MEEEQKKKEKRWRKGYANKEEQKETDEDNTDDDDDNDEHQHHDQHHHDVDDDEKKCNKEERKQLQSLTRYRPRHTCARRIRCGRPLCCRSGLAGRECSTASRAPPLFIHRGLNGRINVARAVTEEGEAERVPSVLHAVEVFVGDGVLAVVHLGGVSYPHLSTTSPLFFFLNVIF